MLRTRPTVAILFNRKTIQNLHEIPRQEASEYLQAATDASINAYLFSIDDIIVSSRSISGWIINEEGNWARENVPWPDIFYDQGKDMTPAERAKADALRKVLTKLVTPVNTARFLDKWFLHRSLVRYPAIAPLLPHTVLCSHPHQLRQMLTENETIIAKPTDSSRGRGISLIRKLSGHQYQVESSMGHIYYASSILSVYRKAQSIAHRKQVLLQKQLHLLQIDNRRFDLRMLMGKNVQGQWIVASPRIRLGQPNSFITNTSQGAERLPLLPTLQQAVGLDLALALYEQVKQAAETICNYIELVVGPMGEIGLDFIVDDQLRIWFIEANPQPGKAPLPHEETKDPPLLYRHVMDYCSYLWNTKASGATHNPRTL